VTAYQAGAVRIGHREAIADIVRATGVFSVLEIGVALELFDVISISAGTRGLQILMAPSDYLRATKGTIAAIAQPKAGWQGRE